MKLQPSYERNPEIHNEGNEGCTCAMLQYKRLTTKRLVLRTLVTMGKSWDRKISDKGIKVIALITSFNSCRTKDDQLFELRCLDLRLVSFRGICSPYGQERSLKPPTYLSLRTPNDPNQKFDASARFEQLSAFRHVERWKWQRILGNDRRLSSLRLEVPVALPGELQDLTLS